MLIVALWFFIFWLVWRGWGKEVSFCFLWGCFREYTCGVGLGVDFVGIDGGRWVIG